MSSPKNNLSILKEKALKKIINKYVKNDLIPFNFSIGWDTIKNKKVLIMPNNNWVNCNKDNYKKYINNDIIKSKDSNVINESNCLGVRMGTTTKDNYKIIGLDIDKKPDDPENKIFNGYEKWLELLKQHNIVKYVSFDTFIQHTGNNGLHYLFKVTLEQYENIKNITSLNIDGTNYSIDVKANENSFLIVEPSQYKDANNDIKYYSWFQNDNIDILPDWIYNLIKTKELNTKAEHNEIKEDEIKERQIIRNLNNNIDTTYELKKDLIFNETKALFFKLSKARLNSYPSWYKLACLIKSIYNEKEALELLIDVSKLSTLYENNDWVIKKFNDEIEVKSYTINTLYYWLKQDKPKEYQTFLINRKKVEKIVDTIEIEQEYLLDIDDENLSKDTVINNKFREFMTDDTIKSININSTYNTAKTQLIKRGIKTYNPKKILWVTYRQSLTNDIKGNFKELEFKSYMDGIYNANRQIIQLESLLKLGDNKDIFIDEEIDIPSYDLIILDEIEGILSHASNSVTFKGMNKEVFEFLEKIIECSKKLITMDGDISNRTYNFINGFGPSINIVNTIKKNKKIFNFMDNKENYKNRIFKELDDNKKVVIVSQCKEDVEALKIEIQNKFTSLKILIYTSMSSDADKMELENVNNIWSKCDVLLYSPTIEAGVNFDVPHFDKIFGIITQNTSCQRAFMQMLARVRKTTDDEIIILNNNFKLNEIKEYFTFYDAYEASKEMKQFKLNRVYDMQKKCYKICYNNYLTNYLYNIVEDKNKETYYFLSKLIEMMKNKGHEVKFTKDDEENKEVININEVLINIDDDDEVKQNEFYLKIINAKLINNDQYSFLLHLKNSNKANEKDKILILKRYYCNILKTDNLNYDELKIWYHNLFKMKNYLNLVDINNFKKNNEVKNEIAFEKLELVKDIMNKIGFENICDINKFVSNDELIESFHKIYKTNKIYTCPKTSALFFKSKYLKLSDDTTTKAILGNLNTILDNYSIKISQKRVRINGNRENVYFIETLNKVDEIINRDINNESDDIIE